MNARTGGAPGAAPHVMVVCRGGLLANAEALDDNKSVKIFIVDGGPEGMAASIGRLIADHGLRTGLGSESRQVAEREFGVRAMGEKQQQSRRRLTAGGG